MTVDDDPPQSAYATGLMGRCPRCGTGHLFEGFLTVAPRCEVCGLDYAFVDTGDGPAFFAGFVGSILVMVVALWIELSADPSIWAMIAIFVPLVLIVCIGPLRPIKGLLIALQYRNKAEEGRLAP